MAKANLIEVYGGDPVNALHSEVSCLMEQLRFVVEGMEAMSSAPSPGASLIGKLVYDFEDWLEQFPNSSEWKAWKESRQAA